MAGLCRICTVALQPTHCASLFTPEGKPKDVAERLGSLLNVPVESDGGLLKRRITQNLDNFGACADSVYQALFFPPSKKKEAWTRLSLFAREDYGN